MRVSGDSEMMAATDFDRILVQVEKWKSKSQIDGLYGVIHQMIDKVLTYSPNPVKY